ncbi:MAG: hypothetical protein DRN00_05150 [Thermoplasmata archaeon]|nr:MAG: hypothetical protein DRN00_05150 [Thermoplasmata archaeon]
MEARAVARGRGNHTDSSSVPERLSEEIKEIETGNAEDLFEIPLSVSLWLVLDDLREIYGIDISDDELDLILLETHYILRIIEDFLVTYIKQRDKIDINRIEAVLLALSSPITAVKIPEKPEEIVELSVEELCILGSLGFSTESVCFIAQAGSYADGAFLMIMLGRPHLTGTLMRGMIELWLKGLLIEHLRNRVLRGQVEERAYRGRRDDSVAMLVKQVEDIRRAYGLESADLIGPAIMRPESFGKELGIRLPNHQRLPKVRLGDILYWLEEWAVFPRDLGLAQHIRDAWRRLCVEVHGDIIKSFLRQIRHSWAVDILLDELVHLSDILLLGLLNTIENTAKSRLWRVDEEAWRKWREYIQEGELYYTGRKMRVLDALRKKQIRRRRRYL